jgi:hypothetical protein
MTRVPRRLLTALLGIFSALLIVAFVSALYPYAGFDYKYFLARLFDTYLHYQVNGLCIQWYTPSFGGGLPAYPNPQQMQFSLPQLLTLGINPWKAALGSIFLYALAGFWGTYAIGRRLFQLDWTTSTLAALFFTINGFYLEHMAIGHLGFQAFPLLPLFLLVLLHPALPDLAAGALIGLLFAMLIHSGGFYPIVYIALSMGILLPAAYLIAPGLFATRLLLRRLGWSAVFAISLSASKIYAILAFMRYFPRLITDTITTSTGQALKGVLAQLAGMMSLGPYALLTGKPLTHVRDLLQDLNSTGLGLWEMDNSISPVLWILVLCGAVGLMVKALRTHQARPWRDWLALFFLAGMLELTLEFCIARGLFYPSLSQLPILKSLHVNTRYSSAYLLPLALAGALVFEWLRRRLTERQGGLAFASLAALTCLSAAIYFISPMQILQRRQYYAAGIASLYDQRPAAEIYPVEQIQATLNDPRVFDQHASNLNPYEVIFGYNIGQLKLDLVPGSVWEIRQGRYNMTNPTGYVFPAENHTTVFERIPAGQADTLTDFVNRRQPANWRVPPAQLALNGLGLAGLAAEALILGRLTLAALRRVFSL